MRSIRLGKWEMRFGHRHEWDQIDMDSDFDAFLCGEIRSILETNGCGHGHDMSSTPPMMYPEAIMCALHFQREQGKKEGELAAQERAS